MSVWKSAVVASCVVALASSANATPIDATPAVDQAATQQPQAPAAEEGDPQFEPTVGQEGKDVVWVPTSPELIELMLDMAKVTPDDFVMDLGSGDGRNIIAAAQRGARGLGVEYNPDMVAVSRRLAREAGVADRAAFVQGDMYVADISKATVLALFLLPSNLQELRDKFLALPPGTRIVLNTFTLEGWTPAETQDLERCTSWCRALLLIVPANVAGTWRIDGGRLELSQEYEELTGTIARDGAASAVVTGRIRAADLTLTANGLTYEGRVEGNRITGTVTDGSGATRPWSAARQ